jgi:hypothetical protein
MQTTIIGLFGLKSKPGASFATIPLLVFNIMFNEYCKVRLLPTFQCRPVQVRLWLFRLLSYFLDGTTFLWRESSENNCNNRALSFGCLMKICKENDDLDKTEGDAQGSSDHAIKAYTPPWMRPTGCSSESSSVQPLVRCLI